MFRVGHAFLEDGDRPGTDENNQILKVLITVYDTLANFSAYTSRLEYHQPRVYLREGVSCDGDVGYLSSCLERVLGVIKISKIIKVINVHCF